MFISYLDDMIQVNQVLRLFWLISCRNSLFGVWGTKKPIILDDQKIIIRHRHSLFGDLFGERQSQGGVISWSLSI